MAFTPSTQLSSVELNFQAGTIFIRIVKTIKGLAGPSMTTVHREAIISGADIPARLLEINAGLLAEGYPALSAGDQARVTACDGMVPDAATQM